MFWRALGLCVLLSSPYQAAFIPLGTPVPKRDKPPVLFVTGHDAVCPDPRSGELPFFYLSFGNFDRIMDQIGRITIHYDLCTAGQRPPIETIANHMGKLIEGLRYEDGSPVTEMDVVSHSMGGLIVRSYLAGKQIADNVFLPPVRVPFRKMVFIGSPNFGTPVAGPTDADPQLREMSLGSKFLFDLATWNQGTDDLRGIDSLALIGTAGITVADNFSDSVVTVTSASLDFAGMPARVLPLCHTYGGLGSLFLCSTTTIGLARITDETHPTARIVSSFLEGTDAWKSIGTAPAQDRNLSRSTGLLVQLRSPDDRIVPISSATVAGAAMHTSNSGLAYSERVSSGTAQLTSFGGFTSYGESVALAPGGSSARLLKRGPVIARVLPAAGPAKGLVVAPGMAVSIYGKELGSASVSVADWQGRQSPVPIQYSSDTQLNAVLPNVPPTSARLTVNTPGGAHTVNLLVEPMVPVLYKRGDHVAALDSATGAIVEAVNPARSGQVVSFFLTGLGATVPLQGLEYAAGVVDVEVGGIACPMFYAGRAPGFPGLDQINCRIPAGLAPGVTQVVVKAGGRTSTAPLAIR